MKPRLQPLSEEAAIASLKRLAKRWPKSLWLFSAAGSLCIMKKDDNGNRVMLPGASACGGAVDPDMQVDTINIENDGGDW